MRVKTKQRLQVRESIEIAQGVWSLVLQYDAGSAPDAVVPGQFVGVYPRDGARLLPRPISICGWDEKDHTLRLVYRVVGGGTREFTTLAPGDAVDVLGILGNGYDLAALTGRRVLFLGGGIGAPPLLELAKRIQLENRKAGRDGSVTSVLGYRTNELFLSEEFSQYGPVVIATDDGTVGVHGNVIDAVREKNLSFDAICACGPMPMLRGVKALSEERGVSCWLSLEERMACGVGVCLGCVAKTTKKNAHSKVNNARVCTEGPVFNAADVEI